MTPSCYLSAFLFRFNRSIFFKKYQITHHFQPMAIYSVGKVSRLCGPNEIRYSSQFLFPQTSFFPMDKPLINFNLRMMESSFMA